jgi:hypothetical protein
MTQDNSSAAGRSADIARRLDALDASLDRAVRAARRRNTVTLVLSIVSLCLIAFYLKKAHGQFTSWDANQVAAYGQARLVDYMPDAAQDLKKSLREQAPSVISTGEQRLRELPDRFASTLESQFEQQLTARTPEAEQKLYDALKASLTEADAHVQAAGGAKGGDEERFKSMLDTLAHAYGTETTKLLDDVHGNYQAGSGDLVGYLDLLADGKQLTPPQQSQRTMIRNFLVLAREHHANSATANGAAQAASDVQAAATPVVKATTRPAAKP